MNATRQAVLEALAAGPITGPELADQLDISRTAVWKHVEALREAGFDVDSGADGYVLDGVSGYNEYTISYGLEAPFSIEYHDTLDSTNDRARELAVDGAKDVAVLADVQTGGRGRLDRQWESPSGGVWCSIVCRPKLQPTEAPVYTLVGAVAAARTIREAGIDARLKWPNDVVVPDGSNSYRKITGILTEMEAEPDRISWLVVGIGVNVTIDQSALPEGATSVATETGHVDRRRFVQRLLEQFDDARTQIPETVATSRDLSLTIGQRVRVKRQTDVIVGEAVDVTDVGSLVVETDDGRQTVAAGDCEHLRPA